MTYTIYPNFGKVVRDSDGVVVAPTSSPESQDYKDWLAWCAQGNEPAVNNDAIPAEVPESVTPRQIRLALNRMGLREMVESAVKTMPQDIRDTWEYALEIERQDPLVLGMAYQLGMDVDEVFRVAATL
jgi:hypothetical protein